MIGGRPYTDRTTLIKGGYVLTLDPELGDLPHTDVLIDGDKIAAVGPNLQVSPNANVIDARNRIVMPGFVDTHRHTWQTPVRGVLPSCTLDQYFSGMLDNIGIQYRAEDVYIANLMGALEALNGGITTLLDWSHVNNTPEHADAAIAGLTEAGIRAVYAHGPPVGASTWWAYSSQEHPEDVRRIRKQYFNSDDQLLTLALAARAPGNTTPEVATHDWKLARDLGIRISVHVGMRLTGVHVNHIKNLHDLGLMGPDTTYIHCTDSTDEELDLIAKTGGTTSVAPYVEMLMGHGVPPTGRLVARGVRPSLSHRRRVERARRHVHADAHGARAGAHPGVHRHARHRVRADADASRRARVRDDRRRARLRARSQDRHDHARQAGRRHPDPHGPGERRARRRSRGDRRHLRRHVEHRHGVRRRPHRQAQRPARARRLAAAARSARPARAITCCRTPA